MVIAEPSSTQKLAPKSLLVIRMKGRNRDIKWTHINIFNCFERLGLLRKYIFYLQPFKYFCILEEKKKEKKEIKQR